MPALRTFALPCCVLGVLVQFCRRTYLNGWHWMRQHDSATGARLLAELRVGVMHASYA